jgi:hypothetical protein
MQLEMSLKRTASSQGSSSGSQAKKANVGSKPLDSWLSVSLPKPPHLFGQSEPLQDQDSTFLAWAANAESPQDIAKLRNWVLEVGNALFRDDPPSHTAHGAVSHSCVAEVCISCYRC